ncbi:type I restriction enzyme endonuclease domain-containing protein [Paenibacillus allorhizosphaerae]|uniref:type I restriction enzyme endonuclease domain-containing protein n=1 Tax=Paenibacillus allorhizosphaerae TaxID=2849866 RepID=UPI001C40348C|nr:type I restriction enzyme endonuclease domain-containing protein [Paenibacillus allorhizosphaerae]
MNIPFFSLDDGQEKIQDINVLKKGGVEHVLKERVKETFLKHVARLQSEYIICATALDFSVRVQISFFIAVKSFIIKVERDSMPDTEAFKKKITAMIEQAIIIDGAEVVSISAKKEKKSSISRESAKNYGDETKKCCRDNS